MSWGWYNYGPSLTVAEKRERAEQEAAKLAKKGHALNPVCIEGRGIARSFWGKAWCQNLESYSDYASRLPRGRSYVRNGCVIDLQIDECCVQALVSGTELYKVSIKIDPVRPTQWNALKAECAGEIGSLIDLLQGKLSGKVMEIMTRRGSGLFPAPSEIRFKCSCPDSAYLCKHIAATLYGVGARLDEQPKLLFVLRDADYRELITQAADSIAAGPAGGESGADVLAEGDLASVFGIELDGAAEMETSRVAEAAPVKTVPRKSTKARTASGAKRAPKKKVPAASIAARRTPKARAAQKPAKETTRKVKRS